MDKMASSTAPSYSTAVPSSLSYTNVPSIHVIPIISSSVGQSHDSSPAPGPSSAHGNPFPHFFTPHPLPFVPHSYPFEPAALQRQAMPTVRPHSTPPTAPFAPSPTAPSDAKPTRTIVLGHGQCVEFTAHDVGPPPAVSFANDLPQLNRMWDDTSKHWDGHSVLTIKGTPIPIVYWKEVYARSKSGVWKPGHWKQVKGRWSEWKVKH